jgi:hypothetical protein
MICFAEGGTWFIINLETNLSHWHVCCISLYYKYNHHILGLFGSNPDSLNMSYTMTLKIWAIAVPAWLRAAEESRGCSVLDLKFSVSKTPNFKQRVAR